MVVLVGPREAGAAPLPAPDVSATASPSQPPVSSLDAEPRRDPALRLMNGVLDANYVYFCALEPETGAPAAGARPFPEAGLAPGESIWFSPSDEQRQRGLSWDLVATTTPLQVGLTCEVLGSLANTAPQSAPAPLTDSGIDEDAGGIQADAGVFANTPLDAAVADASLVALDAGVVRDAGAGFVDGGGDVETQLELVEIPEVRMVPLATLPAGVLDELSTLLVAAGCVGGYPKDPQDVCGSNYGRGLTTLTPIFVTLSRQNDFGSIGMQFLNASSMGQASLRSEPSGAETTGSFFTVASRVARGAIAPNSVRTGIDWDTIGEPLADVFLRVEEGDNIDPIFTVDWESQLAKRSVLLEAGRAHTFVLIGAPKGDGRQFHSLSIEIVSNDPVHQEPIPRDAGR